MTAYTRVATHSTQSNYVNRMMLTQSRVAKYSESVTSGQKSSTYSGIASSTLNLLKYETQVTKTNQFLQNNSVTTTKLSAMETSLETITDETTDFRSALRELLGTDLSTITDTMSEDTLSEISNIQQLAFNALKQIEDALNIQVDGEYLFSGGKTLNTAVTFPYSTLEEFQSFYDGDLVTYPSSAAANLSSVETKDSVTGGFTLSQHIAKLGYDDAGNPVAVAGAFAFSYDDNKITANAGTFSEFEAGGTISITGTEPAGLNDGTYLISSISDDGSTIRLDASTALTAPSIPTYTAGLNPDGVTPITMTIDNGSGATTNVDFSTTNNDITFDYENNKVTAANYYTFSGVEAGDTLTFTGTACDPYGSGTVDNDRTFTVVSVSDDGKEVVLEEVISNPNIPDGHMDGNAGDMTMTQDNNVGYIDSVNTTGTTIVSLDTGANDMVFSGNTITVDPLAVPDFFKNIKAGQSIEIAGSTSNDGTYYVTGVDLATGTITVDTALTAETSQNITVEGKSLEHGFVSENILGGAGTTGTLYFNTAKNQMVASVDNAFSTLKAGDTIIVEGTANNNGVKIIESVSEDGKTITFTDDTPVIAEGTPIDPPFNTYTKIDNGTGVNIGKSYAIGSTISLNDIDPSYNGSYTVTGVSEDGNRLIVKADNFPQVPFTAASETFLANGKMSISSSSYYQGDQLETQIRTDTDSILNVGVNAENSALEKTIRALCIIAQGSLVDTDSSDGLDTDRTLNRVNEALDLLDEALGTENTGESTLNSLTYKVSLNQVSIENTITNQKATVALLQSSVDGIEKINSTQAALLLQEEALVLEYSYSAISLANGLTLLNYM